MDPWRQPNMIIINIFRLQNNSERACRATFTGRIADLFTRYSEIARMGPAACHSRNGGSKTCRLAGSDILSVERFMRFLVALGQPTRFSRTLPGCHRKIQGRTPLAGWALAIHACSRLEGWGRQSCLQAAFQAAARPAESQPAARIGCPTKGQNRGANSVRRSG